MKAKNRYYSHSRIAEAKFRQIIRFFAMDFTASDTAKLTNISVRSINTIYIKLRKKIAVQCEEISPFNGIENAPELESKLHRHFNDRRINKVNYRKEFFEAKLEEIREIVSQFGHDALFHPIPEAKEYRQTLEIIENINKVMLEKPTILNVNPLPSSI